ncbi:K+/H+ antiporter subunit F [Marinobacterium aestuariivivens]|uniref:K+/H+ antiporter subunit F n=1 Tax=Marinobacterium aestuariivivens TaxID=1698799 RepID=A0ABW1ZZ29_9GAMM
MLNWVLPLVLTMVSLALILNLWSLQAGPSLPDRTLALDTMYINSSALIILFGIWKGTALYFEAALLIAMLGFIGTVAVCKYLLRGDIIE